MIIKWFGHSCFKITLKNGKSIMIDPFDETVGYEKVDEKADIVLVSHDHYDHSYIKAIQGEYTLINSPGTYKADGVEITGVSMDHDDQQGKLRGKVVVFTIQAEGIRIMHLSDIGVMPDEGFFANAGKIDILMIPVGGVYTIDAKVALQIMERFSPNITIPMHYMTEVSKIQLKGVHEFARLVGKEYDISRLGGSSLEITADNMKKRQRVFIMDFAN
jgi:L-ascorbate metabolism protein UlaG (beta-lactamase superfamily)